MSPSGKLDIPLMFVCPITCALMKDPVGMPDGYVYERSAIAGWVGNGKPSPLNPSVTLRMGDARPETLLKAQIARFARAPFPITVRIDSGSSSQDITTEVALWDTIAQLKQKIAVIRPNSGALTISSNRGAFPDDATMEDTGVYGTRKLCLKSR
jgi:hypothetical protein